MTEMICTTVGCRNPAGRVIVTPSGLIEALCPACRVVMQVAYDVTSKTSLYTDANMEDTAELEGV